MARISDRKLRKSRFVAVTLIWVGCFLMVAVFPWKDAFGQTAQKQAHEKLQQINDLLAKSEAELTVSELLLAEEQADYEEGLSHLAHAKGIRNLKTELGDYYEKYGEWKLNLEEKRFMLEVSQFSHMFIRTKIVRHNVGLADCMNSEEWGNLLKTGSHDPNVALALWSIIGECSCKTYALFSAWISQDYASNIQL